jgi:hypothetical protein
MSGYLRHLAERSLGMADVARAVVPPLYADWRRAGPAGVVDTLGSEGRDDLEVVTEEGSTPQRAPWTPRPPRSVEPIPKDSETADTRPARSRRADRASDASRPAVAAAEVLELPPVMTRAPRESRRIEPVETPTPEPRQIPLPSRTPGPATAEPAPRSAEAGPRSATARVTVPVRVSIPPILRRTPGLPALQSSRPVEARRTTLAPVGAPTAPIPRVVVPRPAAASTHPPGSGRGPDGTAMPAQHRIVEISIGRIEVRATPAPVREHRAPTPRPTLSLDAYLQGRAREGRR